LTFGVPYFILIIGIFEEPKSTKIILGRVQKMKEPFSQKNLDAIFKVNLDAPDILISRESGILEFKKSFGHEILSNAMKTIAGFANNEGGYIVFGVEPKPHNAVGLSQHSLEKFDEYDPEKFTTNLNNHFAPEIKFQFYKYQFQNNVFGMLYIWPSSTKPVICINNEGNNLRESAIYYRYRGQSREIKYSELRGIIDAEIEKTENRWKKIIKSIGEAGASNAALLHLDSGKVIGPNANTPLYIDEKLLDQISFVQEGSFVKTGGNPTLVVKGEVQTIAGAREIVVERDRFRGINHDVICKSFIKQERVTSPYEYIEQICYQTTGSLPVYYYAHLAGLSIDELIDKIDNVPNNSQAKKFLLKRLRTRETRYQNLKTSISMASKKRSEYLKALRDKSLEALPQSVDDFKYCIIAIRHLEKQDIEINREYLFNLLYRIYSDYFYNQEYEAVKPEIRYALCWIDEALYMDTNNIKNER